ncbi:MAG: DUF2071 domain-containing protein [Verrucomicrobia bacterium]|nr:DUF2071 domain-containing protein [Cytophagales bacterium]
MKVFLTAEWRNLINLTYEVSPDLLEEYLPAGLEIDTALNGKAHVSLVAFDFLNTKVKGIKIPFHVDFPEINLRFYVRYKGLVGVVFIREFVPKFWITTVANVVYNEPYRTIAMQSSLQLLENQTKINAVHTFRYQNQTFEIETTARNQPFFSLETSTEHYFKEHAWGFGTNHAGRTLAYRVEHPIWRIYPFESFRLLMDFEKIYGEKWAFLNKMQPTYQVFAEGSAVKVYEAMSLSGV